MFSTSRRLRELAEAALKHGWKALFAGNYLYAGGAAHYAAYLESSDGFEVELIASRPSKLAQSPQDV
ncbi:hypothetical protein ACX80D_03455 [Arthrobacter sp. Sr24]